MIPCVKDQFVKALVRFILEAFEESNLERESLLLLATLFTFNNVELNDPDLDIIPFIGMKLKASLCFRIPTDKQTIHVFIHIIALIFIREWEGMNRII